MFIALVSGLEFRFNMRARLLISVLLLYIVFFYERVLSFSPSGPPLPEPSPPAPISDFVPLWQEVLQLEYDINNRIIHYFENVDCHPGHLWNSKADNITSQIRTKRRSQPHYVGEKGKPGPPGQKGPKGDPLLGIREIDRMILTIADEICPTYC
ncbi:uncharacterized protein LOC143244278 [Tachypleus tridentatus]|uniref:uncharacterized protein LOC143244278 n=1 Tax=Tachypleus tridentatus TaxID=6853 RepID=UPI003FD0494A